MKKRTLALIMVLAMTLGAATVALAETTDGKIQFVNGGVTIVPPGKPEIDPDGGDSEAYKYFKFGGNLYFGEWNIGSFGTYASRNETAGTGEFTGVQVVNRTAGTATIEVSVSEFRYGTTGPVLTGAELTLIAKEKQVGAGFDIKNVAQEEEVVFSPNTAATVLETPAGSRVKASWTGELKVLPGTSIQVGDVQATLTWIVAAIVP